MNTTTLSLSRPGLRWLAGGLAVGLLTASLRGSGVATAQAQSADADETVRTLSVSGTGRVNATPDVADISLGVFEQAKEAAARAAYESLIDGEHTQVKIVEAKLANARVALENRTIRAPSDGTTVGMSHDAVE